jgi:cytochrome c551/c552
VDSGRGAGHSSLVKVLSFVLAAAFASGAAFGQDALRSRGCTNCHDTEKHKVGPSLREIGAKYKGDKSKAPQIVARMKEGKGHPKVAGADAELQAAVEAAFAAK